MAQDSTPPTDATPKKSEEFLRFEALARRMFNTPKMEASTPKKASTDCEPLQVKMQAE